MKLEFGLSSSDQLNLVDKLRELGVGDYVALPQLVVVGDQSSGKSSVLEAISNIPFSRDSGLCTRFATQITMRRTPRENITVSIIPAANSSQEKKRMLRLLKACEVIGVSSVGRSSEPGKSNFSKDVLKFEINGPNVENLSMIDIPGIFRTPTPGVTTEDDIQLVRNMILSYIRDERTILLLVVPAPVDIATQEILTLAQEVDPDGIRTLGVLTKPDLVDKGAEQKVIDLVDGNEQKLLLEYCIVRNKGQQELTSSVLARQEKENAFFDTEPWSRLGKTRVGVSALRDRLRELLADITRREFPMVRSQIEKQLATSRENLEILGADRSTSEQQRSYLQQIATHFQQITDHALDAYYSRDPGFEEIPAFRLPTIMAELNARFADAMKEAGHTHDFAIEKAPKNLSARPKWNSEAAPLDYNKYPDIRDLLVSDDAACLSRETCDILAWIREVYQKNRSYGVEMANPAILSTLWSKQTTNWENMAQSYISSAIFFVHEFILSLLGYVCPDERTRRSLINTMFDAIYDSYQKSLDHIQFLVQVERHGKQLTYNRTFSPKLQRLRTQKLEKSLRRGEIKAIENEDGDEYEYVKLSAIPSLVSTGNEDYTVQDLHSILCAYYNIASMRFIDAVCMQGTDYHLLSGKGIPLRIFSSLFVASLSNEQLQRIAGEDQISIRKRKALNRQIKALEEGKRLLRSYG